MDNRACGIALLIAAGVASPYGSGEDDARAPQQLAVAAVHERQEVVLAGASEWSAPEWEYSVQLLEPSLRAAQGGSRNPAGRLVLPAPQTSHAPAF